VGLFLLETSVDGGDVEPAVSAIDAAARTAAGELIEARGTRDGHLFAIVETPDAAGLREALDGHLHLDDLAPVRLVGADLDEVKATRDASPGYLVEWDLPDGLDMDTYLARKRAKSPRYAEVPEVTFRRTYVREDLDKCLCFYDATCEEDVHRARKVVDAPVDRLHELS
jgi:hypothetical protein